MKRKCFMELILVGCCLGSFVDTWREMHLERWVLFNIFWATSHRQLFVKSPALPSICKVTAKTLQLNGIGFWCLCRLTAKESCPKKGLWLGTSTSDVLGDYVVLTFVSTEWKWMEHAENPFFVFILPSVRSKTLPTPPTQVAQLQHASYSNTLVVSVKFSENFWQTFPVEVEMDNSLYANLNFDLSSWKHTLWHCVDECFCSGILKEIRASMSNMYNYQFLCAQNLNFKSNQQKSICHEIIKAKTACWTRFPPKTEKTFFNHHQMNFKVCCRGKFVVPFHRRLGIFPQKVVV